MHISLPQKGYHQQLLLPQFQSWAAVNISIQMEPVKKGMPVACNQRSLAACIACVDDSYAAWVEVPLSGTGSIPYCSTRASCDWPDMSFYSQAPIETRPT